MVFGDLSASSGQQVLNGYLADKSYIEGYVASQADSVVFKAVTSAPPTDLPHLLRWYNHIKSLGVKTDSLPGIAKPLDSYGPADAAGADDDDDDDVDLFGDSEDEEEAAAAAKLKEERLAAYTAKKANKPKVIAKSMIILDVKPWDDETDMAEVEQHVRSIEMDGLLWGASKLVAVGYGIKKLQISCVVEDEKNHVIRQMSVLHHDRARVVVSEVGTYDLEEKISVNEDLVQSVDIAAFNKV